MKKILLFFVMAITTNLAMAQKVDFGIRARYTAFNLQESIHDGSSNINGSTERSYNIDAGIFADINYGAFTFQPGIAYVLKGGTEFYDSMPTAQSYAQIIADTKINYLEIPLNLLYNFQLKPGKIFIGTGPYIGVALSGKDNNTTFVYQVDGTEVARNSSNQSINFGSGQDNLKRLDYGINTIAGFRLNNGLEIGAALGFGLANLTNVDALKVHNHSESISVGYFF